MSDEDARRLERQARALGVNPRDVAAELLGIERGRFALLVHASDGPLAPGSQPVTTYQERAGFRERLERIAWLTPLETLEEAATRGWTGKESAELLDRRTGRLFPTGERVEVIEGWPVVADAENGKGASRRLSPPR